ncbi:hypothetical protein TI39_contig451g00012 [Zymoseptoria brevis]|uniref:Uncharacterized protein n=1 Tax=Zymoseptoria brevis TaxID=1047168 RepID=A0A0F4GP33_9PEZI|nr:hypothetical protein TI39_contig451g00012 [Zymoseptoria brevis]
MRTTTAASAALFVSTSLALDSLVAPSSIVANQNFTLTASDPDPTVLYRIYLAATLSDTTGPTCVLLNSTTLPPSGALSLSIPASVGPDASYYSIAISPLTSSSSTSASDIIYTPPINITGLTASYTPYETSLRGAPFYDADMLPCSSYACARKCADQEFPAGSEGDGEEEEKGERYGRMVECFGGCDGVGVEVEGGSGVESQGGMTMTMTVSTSAEGEATATATRTTTTTTGAGASEADATEEAAAAATSSGVAAPRQATLAGVIAIAGLAVVGIC